MEVDNHLFLVDFMGLPYGAMLHVTMLLPGSVVSNHLRRYVDSHENHQIFVAVADIRALPHHPRHRSSGSVRKRIPRACLPTLTPLPSLLAFSLQRRHSRLRVASMGFVSTESFQCAEDHLEHAPRQSPGERRNSPAGRLVADPDSKSTNMKSMLDSHYNPCQGIHPVQQYEKTNTSESEHHHAAADSHGTWKPSPD